MFRLRELREEKGISQKELGKLFNVAQNTISNWENGTREPDTKTLMKLAEFFECSVDYLVGRTDDPRPPDPDIKNAPLAFYGNTEGLNLDILKQIISEAVNEALEEREKKKKNEL